LDTLDIAPELELSSRCDRPRCRLENPPFLWVACEHVSVPELTLPTVTDGIDVSIVRNKEGMMLSRSTIDIIPLI
jgi:hypothetical protein